MEGCITQSMEMGCTWRHDSVHGRCMVTVSWVVPSSVLYVYIKCRIEALCPHVLRSWWVEEGMRPTGPVRDDNYSLTGEREVSNTMVPSPSLISSATSTSTSPLAVLLSQFHVTATYCFLSYPFTTHHALGQTGAISPPPASAQSIASLAQAPASPQHTHFNIYTVHVTSTTYVTSSI